MLKMFLRYCPGKVQTLFTFRLSSLVQKISADVFARHLAGGLGLFFPSFCFHSTPGLMGLSPGTS